MSNGGGGGRVGKWKLGDWITGERGKRGGSTGRGCGKLMGREEKGR